MDLPARSAARERAALGLPRTSGIRKRWGLYRCVTRAESAAKILLLVRIVVHPARPLLCLYAMRGAGSYPRHATDTVVVHTYIRTQARRQGAAARRSRASSKRVQLLAPAHDVPRRACDASALYLYIAHGYARRSSRLRTGRNVRVK